MECSASVCPFSLRLSHFVGHGRGRCVCEWERDTHTTLSAIFSTAHGSHDFYLLMTSIYLSNKTLLVKGNVYLFLYVGQHDFGQWKQQIMTAFIYWTIYCRSKYCWRCSEKRSSACWEESWWAVTEGAKKDSLPSPENVSLWSHFNNSFGLKRIHLWIKTFKLFLTSSLDHPLPWVLFGIQRRGTKPVILSVSATGASPGTSRQVQF